MSSTLPPSAEVRDHGVAVRFGQAYERIARYRHAADLFVERAARGFPLPELDIAHCLPVVGLVRDAGLAPVRDLVPRVVTVARRSENGLRRIVSSRVVAVLEEPRFELSDPDAWIRFLAALEPESARLHPSVRRGVESAVTSLVDHLLDELPLDGSSDHLIDFFRVAGQMRSHCARLGASEAVRRLDELSALRSKKALVKGCSRRRTLLRARRFEVLYGHRYAHLLSGQGLHEERAAALRWFAWILMNGLWLVKHHPEGAAFRGHLEKFRELLLDASEGCLENAEAARPSEDGDAVDVRVNGVSVSPEYLEERGNFFLSLSITIDNALRGETWREVS